MRPSWLASSAARQQHQQRDGPSETGRGETERKLCGRQLLTEEELLDLGVGEAEVRELAVQLGLGEGAVAIFVDRAEHRGDGIVHAKTANGALGFAGSRP